jgi:hypothetical protein
MGAQRRPGIVIAAKHFFYPLVSNNRSLPFAFPAPHKIAKRNQARNTTAKKKFLV